MYHVWLRVRHRDRLLDHAKGGGGTSSEDRLGRCNRQQVASEHELDRQQVLEHAHPDVGLAYAQRRSRVVVLDAEVEQRRVESGRCRELLEFPETAPRLGTAAAARTTVVRYPSTPPVHH
jgi:hypothetical protein